MSAEAEVRPQATGTLSKTPLAHLLVYMAERKLDGTLVFQGPEGGSSAVFFAQGAPAKAKTCYAGTHLGRVLLQLGFINDATLTQSLLLREQSGQLHGQILLAQGKLDRAQLLAGLREQLMRRLLRLFDKLGEPSRYAFYQGVNLIDPWGGPELTPIEPYRVLWEGVHIRPHDPHIDTILTRMGQAPVRLAQGVELQRFGFGKAESKALELLQVRPSSLSELLALELVPVRQTKLLLYVLFITRSIELVGTQEPSPPERKAPPPPRTSSVQEKAPPSSKPAHAADRPAPPKKISSRPPTPPAAMQRPSGPRAVSSASMPQAAPEIPSTVTVKRALGQPKTPPVDRETVLARAQEIDQLDFFQLLEVTQNDSPEALRTAYFAQAKRWHPDRLPAPLADLRDQATKVFGRLSEAYQTLSDPERRPKYIEELTKGGSEQVLVQRVLEATVDFQKAEVFARKRDFEKAAEHCRKALAGDPQQPDYIALHAWLLAMQPERLQAKDFAESMKLLNGAIQHQPRCERALFYRGSLYRLLGKADQALADFRKVIELNPRNIEAAREVRVAQMRAPSKPPSILPKAPVPSRPPPVPAGDPMAEFYVEDDDPSPASSGAKDRVSNILGRLFNRS